MFKLIEIFLFVKKNYKLGTSKIIREPTNKLSVYILIWTPRYKF